MKCDGSDEHATAHTVAYKGKICKISVRHLKCSSLDMVDCNTIDVRLFRGCPTQSYAINIENFVPLRTGDEASGLGYILDFDKIKERFWRGHLAGRLGSSKLSGNEHSYLIESVAQLQGMSGGPTINGCGYTGMVNGVQDFFSLNQSVSYATVIPAKLIAQCIAQHSTILEDIESCPNTTIVEVPRYYLECRR